MSLGNARSAQLAELYRAVRLYVTFFQPSMKLGTKTRNGSRVRRMYGPALDDCDVEGRVGRSDCRGSGGLVLSEQLTLGRAELARRSTSWRVIGGVSVGGAE
jgi:hypothetical protein